MLQCQICKKNFKHLGSHVYHAHKMFARDYKQMFGLNINHPLITKEIKEKKRKHFWQNSKKYLKNLEGGTEYQFKKGQRNRFYFSKEDLQRAQRNTGKMSHKGTCPVCGIEYNHVFNHMRMKHNLLVINLNSYKWKRNA